jgi:hypothetical protein
VSNQNSRSVVKIAKKIAHTGREKESVIHKNLFFAPRGAPRSPPGGAGIQEEIAPLDDPETTPLLITAIASSKANGF